MVGQLLGALAQPIFLSTPAVVAANWFPVSERDIATTVGALFNPLGNALGQVIPPFVVVVAGSSGSDDDDSNDADDDDIDAAQVTAGMQRLLVGQAVALGLSFLWMTMCFRSHPPTPPSASAEERLKVTASVKAGRRKQVNTGGGGGGGRNDSFGEQKVAAALRSGDDNHQIYQDRDDEDDDDNGGPAEDPAQVISELFRQFQVLLRDKNFLLLLGAFSIGLAVFNALLTVVVLVVGN
jgi:hypothetical protein